jgi:hypothetical protein
VAHNLFHGPRALDNDLVLGIILGEKVRKFLNVDGGLFRGPKLVDLFEGIDATFVEQHHARPSPVLGDSANAH